MVKIVLISCIFLIFMPSLSTAITADELRELTEVGRAKRGERDGRIKTKELKALIPEEDKTTPLAPEAVPEKIEIQEKLKKKTVSKDRDQSHKSARKSTKATKYNARPGMEASELDQGGSAFLPNDAQASPFPRGLSPRMFKQGADGRYLPPPRTGGYGPLTDASTPDHIRIFGIRIGTWIEGELRRSASNAEPGLIEIYTTRDIRGDKKVLPVGSILFAQKTYNPGTKKLDLLVVKGITPQGREFIFKGLVFDLQKTAGLIGIVTTDSALIVERSSSKGALAAGGAVAERLAGQSLVASAGSAAAESLLEDSSNAIEKSKTLKQSIRSRPQQLLIRVEETF